MGGDNAHAATRQMLAEQTQKVRCGLLIDVRQQGAAPDEIESPGQAQATEGLLRQERSDIEAAPTEVQSPFVNLRGSNVRAGKPRSHEPQHLPIAARKIEDGANRKRLPGRAQSLSNAPVGIKADRQVVEAVAFVHQISRMDAKRNPPQKTFLLEREIW